MTDKQHDGRQWSRFAINSSVEVKFTDSSQHGKVIDISASGAAIAGQIDAAINGPVEISIDEFGKYDAWVVREWEDCFAIAFDMDDYLKTALNEELEETLGKRGQKSN